MELKHIDIAKLSVSSVNMGGAKKAPDIANILPSVRARGVLVPLIVRANGSPDTYEIVAGKRRYHAALAVAEEGGGIDELPCAVIDAGDDAAALEASLIENIARLDPDEVTRWETFTRLVREGRSPEDIALTFGLTQLQVKRTLALGNLLPRIRTLYRNEAIDPVTVRHLTLASKVRQREWLALVDDPETRAPVGQGLKAWLFGGASISITVALFDLSTFAGETVSDLFGEDSYFADSEAFWTAQHAAVEERAETYREAGWREVIVLEPGQPFHTWEHERRAKRQGGKVYIAIGYRGEVTFHEGYISLKEARKLASGEAPEKPRRPEITATGNDYVDLHRHAAVRAKLAEAPGVALRVAVAHMIAGSALWAVRVEPQRTTSEAVAESVETCASDAAFDKKRRAMLALLGFDAETPTITGGEGEGLAALFAKLVKLDDAQLLDILAIVMSETLDARSDIVDAIGLYLNIDMAPVWQADDALLDLIRDRETLSEMVAEVAGREVAEANAKESGKTLRGILRDCISGSNGRTKVEGWVPRWLRFPASSYTERGGVRAADRSAVIASLIAAEPDIEPVREAA
ncbi:ParB N-terminal domain-containing protein [Stakelama sp. CBK3Z-3]|uniref:ParB N-terminal domain-containing protein n=1 Tax=Stakelama flava TaxID=2860338 RepID=A0ABS6XPG7_9SPHN|nr:ParB N-terminal domain-containing protein [Stakelama flava]MBW4332112.1 ParB N-terminal domain-containing protein [Stakelama flava]